MLAARRLVVQQFAAGQRIGQAFWALLFLLARDLSGLRSELDECPALRAPDRSHTRSRIRQKPLNSGESGYPRILANPATPEFWRIRLPPNSGESGYGSTGSS